MGLEIFPVCGDIDECVCGIPFDERENDDFCPCHNSDIPHKIEKLFPQDIKDWRSGAKFTIYECRQLGITEFDDWDDHIDQKTIIQGIEVLTPFTKKHFEKMKGDRLGDLKNEIEKLKKQYPEFKLEVSIDKKYDDWETSSFDDNESMRDESVDEGINIKNLVYFQRFLEICRDNKLGVYFFR
jgi:hypothetical protein